MRTHRRRLAIREILLNAIATAGLLIGLPLLAIGIADWVRWN